MGDIHNYSIWSVCCIFINDNVSDLTSIQSDHEFFEIILVD